MHFLPGQVYQLPGLETGATATVCHVDDDPFSCVVHVRIEGVRIPNPEAPGGISKGVHLMPFTEEALAESVGKMISDNVVVTNWEKAYDAWRTAYEEGEATVWSLPVYDAIQVMQSMLA
jgi:hypothetical protein